MPSSGGQVGAEPVEQRRHRGLVGGVGGHLTSVVPGRASCAAKLVEPLAGVARHRDDRAGAHVGELPDQVRADVAGRADDQVAAVRVERGIGAAGAVGCSRGTCRTPAR